MDIIKVMDDVDDAVRDSLKETVIKESSITAKISEIVVPALGKQEQIIDRNYRIIKEQEELIGELQFTVEWLNKAVKERVREDERQKTIELFNNCSDGKVVYS
jgi:hypothetical protein